MAAFVLRAPSDRLFGMEIVGRHHDPFTVMAQFERRITFGVYLAARHRSPWRAARAPLGSGGRVQLAGPSQLSTLGRRGVPARALSGAVSAGRGRRGNGVRVLPVPRRAGRLSPSHRADAVDPALPARVVAVSRRRDAGGGRVSRRRDDRGDALELLRGSHRRRHHPDRRRCLLARHHPDGPAIDAPAGHHRRNSPGDRRLRRGVHQHVRRGPLGLRVSPRRPVPLQREVVGLSGSAGRASAARRNRASHLERGGRARGSARATGQPRVGSRRARAHCRVPVARLRRSSPRSRVCRSSSSLPWPRSCARCRRSGRSARSRSSGLPRFCITSRRCSDRMRGSESSCS